MIHYRIDRHAKVIVTEIVGNLSVDDIGSHYQPVVEKAVAGSRLHGLIDLRKADPMPFSITDVDYLATLTQPFSKRSAKLAFVSSDEINVGLCSLYRQFADEHREPIRIFASYDEAWDWLMHGDDQPD